MLVLIDAFNTVDHDTALENWLVLSCKLLNWFESYLKDKYSLVSISSYTSVQIKIACGVHKAPFWGFFCIQQI